MKQENVDPADEIGIGACGLWDGMKFVDFFGRMQEMLLRIPARYREAATIDYDEVSFIVCFDRELTDEEVAARNRLELATREARREDRRRQYEELKKEFGE